MPSQDLGNRTVAAGMDPFATQGQQRLERLLCLMSMFVRQSPGLDHHGPFVSTAENGMA